MTIREKKDYLITAEQMALLGGLIRASRDVASSYEVATTHEFKPKIEALHMAIRAVEADAVKDIGEEVACPDGNPDCPGGPDGPVMRDQQVDKAYPTLKDWHQGATYEMSRRSGRYDHLARAAEKSTRDRIEGVVARMLHRNPENVAALRREYADANTPDPYGHPAPDHRLLTMIGLLIEIVLGSEQGGR